MTATPEHPGRWETGYGSWGRAVRGRHLVSRPATRNEAADLAALEHASPLLAYGNGRSVGDVQLNMDGRLIDCRGLDRFISFDRATAELECEAGVLLADILAGVCRPDSDNSGWFPPVMPGSRFVTVGGAIANDVHGKNQHRLGTFGCHVRSLELARSDGTLMTCSPTENTEMFKATIGGLGLTGLILRATIQMRRVESLALEAEDIRFGGLGEFFDLVADSDAGWEHTAAWVDSMASGPGLGRGIFSRARQASGPMFPPPSRKPLINIPSIPLSLINEMSVRIFNTAYWSKLGSTGRSSSTGSYEGVFFPLDNVGGYNRVFGPRGFHQFQCVVPPGDAQAAIRELLRVTARSGQGSFIVGLKVFGDIASPGMMSFPMQGVTVAIDTLNRGAKTMRLFENLEQVTIEAGGRIYPAKDATMSPRIFRHGYPQAERFLGHVDPRFSSAFARRVGLLPSQKDIP